MTVRDSRAGTKKILLICDFGPGLLDDVLIPYEHMPDTRVTLLRKKHGEVQIPQGVTTVRVPLPVMGTSEVMGPGRLASLAINTLAYLVVGSLLSIYAALRFRCDVVHARFVFPQGVVGLVAAVISRSRLVVTAEGSDINLYLRSGFARAVLLALSRKGEIVSVSKPIQGELSRYGMRSRCIPNSVDGSRFSFVPMGDKEDAILFVGNLNAGKSPQTLIEAVARVHPFLKAKGVRVRMVGDGPMRRALERMVSELGVEDTVTLEGTVPHEKVREYLARSYVYVSCSKGEGMSLALLEAMASGCLLLVSRIPANAALVRDRETGFLFDVGDPSALAAAIRNAFTNRPSLESVPKRARLSFEAKYDVERNSATLAALYDWPYTGRPPARQPPSPGGGGAMPALASRARVVFRPDERKDWMAKSVAFQKVVEDRLFFTGESLSRRWQMGVAESRRGAFREPRKVELVGGGEFFETIAPSVLKASDRYVLVFAGRRRRLDNRKIFLATAKTLDGPWVVEEASYSSRKAWEGRAIDLGPGSFLEDGSALFFYSTAFPRVRQIAASFARSPHLPTLSNLMRYEKRGIGILRVSARAPYTLKGSDAPLPLSCASGPTPDSVFCPGYAALGGRHFFFMACSDYSRGFPFDQWIGVVESDSPPSKWDSGQKIRPIITSEHLPPQFAKCSAFDSPDPVHLGGGVLRVYFSAMSRKKGRWNILSCDVTTDGEVAVA